MLSTPETSDCLKNDIRETDKSTIFVDIHSTNFYKYISEVIENEKLIETVYLATCSILFI